MWCESAERPIIVVRRCVAICGAFPCVWQEVTVAATSVTRRLASVATCNLITIIFTRSKEVSQIFLNLFDSESQSSCFANDINNFLNIFQDIYFLYCRLFLLAQSNYVWTVWEASRSKQTILLRLILIELGCLTQQVGRL